MDSSFVTLRIDNGIAIITMNDGGKNLISPKMIQELNASLDKAEKQGAVVILTGSNEILSAGFDLKTLRSGAIKAFGMLMGGFKLAARLLAFRTPVIIACNGHAVAMGAFLLLSADYRIGVAGNYKIVTNEVAIGLTMPHTGVEVCRQRLAPVHFTRSVLLSEEYNPQSALDAGFLDRVTDADKLLDEALIKANDYSKLDLKAHYKSKLRARRDLLHTMRSAIATDRIDLILTGIKRMLGM